MLSPLSFTPCFQQAYDNRLFRGVLISVLSTSLLLTGCDKSENQINPETKFVVLDNKVIVDHNLILTSIPERYQPSFNLEGILVPALSTDVEIPYPLISSVWMVKEGDEVTKGQVLAKLNAKVAENELQNLATEMVDVYVDGIKIEPKKTKESVQQAVSTHLSKLTATVQPATNSQATHSEPLVDVTLVIKSPIAGKITVIKNKEQLTAQFTHESDNKPNKAVDESISKTSLTKTPKTKTVETENNINYPIIHIDSTHDLQLIGKLPITTQSQLSVGRSVSFTVYDLQTEFTGQISHITPDPQSNSLTVRASLIPGEHNSSHLLEPDMRASMRIEYGQIELGVRLPRQAIHEAVLDNLSAKHSRPNSPIKGYVWVVEQDQSLSYNPVQVVQYFADSDKFLVSGINNDSLVCLADLPKTAAGKTLTVD